VTLNDKMNFLEVTIACNLC